MSLTRESRSGTPWQPPYRYVCGRGHEIHADRPVPTCPMTPHGHPCPGPLKQTAGKSKTGGR